MNFLVRAADGRIVVTSVMLGDQTAPINEFAAGGVAEAAVRAAVTLIH